MSMTATLGRTPGLHRIQQRHGEAGLVGLGRLHPPGQRQARHGADGLVELVAVERPSRPRADCRAVAPGRVGVAWRWSPSWTAGGPGSRAQPRGRDPDGTGRRGEVRPHFRGRWSPSGARKGRTRPPTYSPTPVTRSALRASTQAPRPRWRRAPTVEALVRVLRGPTRRHQKERLWAIGRYIPVG